MDRVESFEKMLANGTDNALLRFGLGGAYLERGDAQRAAAHLASAVEHDPTYSAAWKLYARALAESGREDEAIAAYDRGIETANAKGDVQAAKEMAVAVPGDVSVTGFDDLEIAMLAEPALTTVHVPHREMGRRAAGMLIGMLRDDETPASVNLPTDIRLRRSLGNS